jgi:hypothetical protein
MVRRTTDDAEDVDQALPLPAAVSDLAVGITRGPEPNIVWVSALAVMVLGCVNVLRIRRRRTRLAA